MDFRILGPLEAFTNGQPLALGGSKQRAVLALLLLHANETVSVDRLIEALWGERAPAGAVQSVRVHISRLRKVLNGGGGEGNGPSRLVTRSGGYQLNVEDDALDLARFERLYAEGQRALASDPPRAAELLNAALALWRGPALADLAFEPFAQAEAARLDELRVAALEDRLEADLELGRHAAVASEVEPLIAEHPLRERLRRLQMLALYRCGRQAEALDAYRKARETLVSEIGVEPGPELRELHEGILRQDPELGAPRTVSPVRRPEPREPAPSPAAGSRAPGRTAKLAIVAALGVSVVLLVIGLTSSDDDASATIAENSVGLIDPSSGEVRSQIALAGGPGPSAADADSVWVANTLQDTVSRIDAESGQVATIDVGGEPAGVATGAGFAWVTDATEGTVEQIDPAANRIVGSVKVGNGPRGVAFAYRAVWALAVTDGELVRVSLTRGGEVTDRISVGSRPTAVAAGAGSLWVTDEAAGTVVRVEPGSGRVSEAIAVGNGPSSVAFGEGAVWVANRSDGTVSRIDPATDAVTSTVEVGADPSALTVSEGAIWVANSDDGTVSRLDPETGQVRETLDVGGSPSGIAAASGGVWTSVLASADSHRGGRLSVAMPFGYLYCECVDPASYDLATPSLTSLAYDGLTAYRHVGGAAGSTLVGNLATEVPEPEDGGRTYVFELRPDLRFSDGSEVDPEDFRSSIERMLRINAREEVSAAYLVEGIVGAGECADPSRPCDLSDGIEIDPEERTITIHLTEPDADFPARLALSVASVVPSDSPARFARATPLPGTGPYRIASFDRDTGRAELVRNEEFRVWSQDARPDGFADEIAFTAAKKGSEPEAQLEAVLNGEGDVMTAWGLFGGPLSRERIARLSVSHANLLHSASLGQAEWMFLNVRRPPFDDVRVRRALNYAIDRRHIVELAGGPELAQPTCQILTPGMPGYKPYCPYTLDPSDAGTWTAPDVAKAQQLVDESGTKGTKVTVWSATEGERAPIARYFVSILNELGYRSSLRRFGGPFEDRYFPTVSDSRTGAQIGQLGWALDYLTPANFIQPTLTCEAFVPASPVENANLGQFCDPQVDAEVEAALAQTDADPASVNAAWAAIDRKLVDAAPVVPLFNRRSVTVVSERVQNVELHPFWGVLLDQLWVQ
jgi:YVTN family beta-propeller protein